MSSTRRKLHRRPPLLLTFDCGCSGPNLSDVYVPRPKHKDPTFGYRRKANLHRSSSSSWEESCSWHSACDGNSTTTSFSQGTSTWNSDSAHRPSSSNPTKKEGSSCRISESVAVVKESEDPYLDFQHSILQMIVEKEIYGQADLEKLLDCFLSLNSPSNHQTIVQAFCDVWSRVFPAGRGARDFQGGTWERT